MSEIADAAVPETDDGAARRRATPSDRHFEVVVLGGGPGGYTAAFRCADLGKGVALIERSPTLGGVCLNVGCIPSKVLLHVAEVINDARDVRAQGVDFGEPTLDVSKLRAHKNAVVSRLTRGLAGLAEKRRVTVLQGEGRFSAPDRITLEGADGATTISFDDCIVAAGSRPVEVPGFPRGDPRLLDSTSALEIREIPKRLLVVGGGIIGLEIATLYDALGAAITVVELTDGLIPGCDRDLVDPLQRRISRRYENVFLATRVAKIEPESAGLRVFFDGERAPDSDLFDAVLVAVGRRPNGDAIGAEAAGIEVDERGFIPVDATQRTNVAHIFAVGDVVGEPMLAHKAMHEGRVAAEGIVGLPAAFDAAGIPSVAYTDPEIAWVGLTETEAEEQGTAYEKGAFPWSASGRALTLGRSDGVTKVLVDPETRRVLGAGMVGRNAGELIAEAVLALEMGADAQDVGLSIHPHPTLSETFGLSAEMVEGTITDLYAPRRSGPS
jgi:dihydrolipoamide dehydrogenase